MVKREKVKALIISRRNIGEADRLITLLTREHGLLNTLAKGVRRIPSRRGGHLEPLTRVLAIISVGERHYMTAVETADHFMPLKKMTAALNHAQEINKLLVRVLGENDSQPFLFDALVEAWSVWPTLPKSKQELLEVVLSLYTLRCAGIQPDLTACVLCHKRKPSEAAVLDGHTGGWRCLTCHGSLNGAAYSLSPRLLKALNWLANNPHKALQLAVDDEDSRQLMAAMRSYLTSLEAFSPVWPGKVAVSTYA